MAGTQAQPHARLSWQCQVVCTLPLLVQGAGTKMDSCVYPDGQLLLRDRAVTRVPHPTNFSSLLLPEAPLQLLCVPQTSLEKMRRAPGTVPGTQQVLTKPVFT